METFHKRAIPVHEKVVDKENVAHDVWIDPALFCDMRSINDVMIGLPSW